MNSINDRVFGEITYNYGWTKKEKINIWDRELDIEIIAACYSNEEITDSQRETYLWLKKNKESIFDKLKISLVQYIIANNASEVANSNFDNIFSFVIPKTIVFKQDSDHQLKMVLLLNYKFDRENGIGVIWEKEEIKLLSTQDVVL